MPLLEKDLIDVPAGRSAIWHWATHNPIFCILNGSESADPSYAFPSLVAIGARRSFQLSADISLESLDAFLGTSEYGYLVQLGYGLKDRLQGLTTRHSDPIGFPALFVFEPQVLIRFSNGGGVSIQADDPEMVWQNICQQPTPTFDSPLPSVSFNALCSKEKYLEILEQVRLHLLQGDCYELNYCQEYAARGVRINPFQAFLKMQAVSSAPFSCLYRQASRWLMGASPERFLKKIGERLESRPMKGTAPREKDPVQDLLQVESLRQSQKDRSENIMVVDLVRNDLSRIAQRDSVQVDSLCEVRSFPQVHQLVSTVRALVRPDVTFRQILEACFPMGSMTGAPKRRVMELTDRYECSARGLYSGSIGFLEPNGDFDLNVVIRSLQYESDSGYLSYHVGSGITVYSDPAQEWEECHWKSAGILRIFEG